MKSLIKYPIVSEKSSKFSKMAHYHFYFSVEATKREIKNEIERGFGVKVKSVNTSICRKILRKTKTGKSRVHYLKKAYVSLISGYKISIFEGV